MKSQVFEIFKNISAVKSLINSVKNLSYEKNICTLTSLPGSAKSLLIKLLSEEKSQLMVLCNSSREVDEFKVELNILDVDKPIIVVDDFDPIKLQEKLTDIISKKEFILLSAYGILTLDLPSKEIISKNTTRLEIGSEISYDELIEFLNLSNYEKDQFVDEFGKYSLRGSIIDFWSYSEKRPCRIEYDGDFLESIRYFDPENQRSVGKTEFVTLASPVQNLGVEKTSDIIEYLNDPLIIASSFELHNLAKTGNTPAEKELPVDNDMDDLLLKEFFDEDGHNTDKPLPEEPAGHKKELNDINELLRRKVFWMLEDEISTYPERIELKLSGAPLINSNFELLFNLITEYAGHGFKIIITTENELQSQRLKDLLMDFRTELRELIESNIVVIEELAIKQGFLIKNEKILILTDYQLFNKPYRTKLPSRKKYKRSRARDLGSIRKGDYVVHENFGIGQYAGLETIKIGQIEQESIKILFAEEGKVYVNLNYLGLVKKYSSQENVVPKLSVLGSSEWKNTKKRVKSKIKEASRELIRLYAGRKAATGIAFSADSIWQRELEASFFYEDTPDQIKVTEEVKDDMESENPMDRLICGDVGFGKTEVAVRAAFKAINDGYQVAVLVPTTILAEQHYHTFKDRLIQFPVKIAALSRFASKSKQKEIVNELAEGKVDLVIGTHRLLSKDIIFKNLGLLIIDEEQRFGVMAKEKLRTMRNNVDTLILTATPIPRTLNLSLLGARDLSLIATPPPNRQPIYTSVEKFEIHKVRSWVLEEIKRNGQIFFVHDRVQSIDKIASYLKKHIPEVSIAVAHGQMRASQLEKVIYDFLNKKYHVLVSTKIIESGLDIPNVNTIIINRADKFGLAELHQLRGRVGRSDRQAYAYLLVPSLNAITKKAVKRLQAIEEYTDLGEGFNLSLRDLEIRGAGNILGTEQSGAINSVGFDLYLKMIDEAVEELKQEEFKDIFKDLPGHVERTEPTIDTYFEIGIPKSFMPDQTDRLAFYSALFSMVKIEEIEEIKEEMEDRFGKIPVIIERLILIAILRFYASFALFERIIIQRKKIIFILPAGENEDYYKNKFTVLMNYVMKDYNNEIVFRQTGKTFKFERENKFSSVENVLKNVIEFCKYVNELLNPDPNKSLVRNS